MQYVVPSSIDDPGVIAEIVELLRSKKIPEPARNSLTATVAATGAHRRAHSQNPPGIYRYSTRRVPRTLRRTACNSGRGWQGARPGSSRWAGRGPTAPMTGIHAGSTLAV